MPSLLVLDSSKHLADKKLTIAFVESATAGRLAAEFSMSPQSGTILIGGLVCYDARVKERILGISKELIEKYTPESEEVTKALADKFRNFLDADVHVAVTGLTTPGGSETPEKPVGTMFVHLLFRDDSIPVRKTFKGTPEDIVLQTIDQVAQLILEKVN
jgi:nicotinamide-nucleotide amidase